MSTEPNAGEDPRRAELRARITAARGYFAGWHEDLLALSPDYLERYFEFVSAPEAEGTLPVKLRHMIFLAIDASVAHLYVPGIKRHIELALQHGATWQELFEVLQLATELGALTFATAMPILLEELRAHGTPAAHVEAPADDLRREYEALRGPMPAWMQVLAAHAPDYVRGFAGLSLHPHQHGVLEPKLRELIYLAVYASPVTAHAPSIRLHIRRALELGALPRELIEVLQLASMINFHSCTIGVPILAAALREGG